MVFSTEKNSSLFDVLHFIGNKNFERSLKDTSYPVPEKAKTSWCTHARMRARTDERMDRPTIARCAVKPQLNQDWKCLLTRLQCEINEFQLIFFKSLGVVPEENKRLSSHLNPPVEFLECVITKDLKRLARLTPRSWRTFWGEKKNCGRLTRLPKLQWILF